MFADVMHHHHPHQLRQTQTQHGFNRRPSGGLIQPYSVQEQRRLEDLQNTEPGGFIKPHQYPLPLQIPANVHPSVHLSQPRGDGSEHLLRRKTPNGMLAAGYDGTPVDWTSRPHAVKHVLMSAPDAVVRANPLQHPNLSAAMNVNPASQPMYPPHATDSRLFFANNAAAISPTVGFSPVGAETLFANQQWDMKASALPMVDSMLHQGQLRPHYPQLLGHVQQMPMVLQPMWPPSVGPTASNAPGPYGPYWPNGTFEPYRPAALRDGRFHAQFANISLNDPVEVEPLTNDRGEWLKNQSCYLTYPTNSPVEQLCRVNRDVDTRHQENRAFISIDAPLHRRSDSYVEEARNATESLRLANLGMNGHSNPSRRQSVDSHAFARHGPSFATRSMQQPVLGNPVAGPQHFREKALVWAHRIYGNLVHHTRRENQQKVDSDRRQSHPNIFPKAPRQQSEVNEENSYLPREAQLLKPLSPQDNFHFAKERHDFSRRGSLPQNLAQQPFGGQWPGGGLDGNALDSHRAGWRTHAHQPSASTRSVLDTNSPRFNLNSPSVGSPLASPNYELRNPLIEARSALEVLARLCQESGWKWVDGLLLGGCLAYGLKEYEKALQWYSKVLLCDANNVEATSNMAATFLSLNQRKEAEKLWMRAVKLRPGYFEAVEHLVGVLCGDQRGREAVKVIEYVERSLRNGSNVKAAHSLEGKNRPNGEWSFGERRFARGTDLSRPSEYAIPASDNGRMVALIHAKGNMLYSLQDNVGAAKAFEEAIMIAAGRSTDGIAGLIKQVLQAFAREILSYRSNGDCHLTACETVLLSPGTALRTAEMVFPFDGELPGLREVREGQSKKAAISIASNSLLSLAKIFQDGMSSSGGSTSGTRSTAGVQDILALYYLSLSLQPSPSTANNVGILLASIQQTAAQVGSPAQGSEQLIIPGVMPGSGVHLAFQYYNYGLNLDHRHAHLYTNMGSLLKDIGQLPAAIKLYEKAVSCDSNFDIALANLANAVKDQGRVGDAIKFYKRAVTANPDFAEAVCGLANALNSVCCWNGRGGVVFANVEHDRWHVDESGMLLDAKEPLTSTSGWIGRVVSIVEKQLRDGLSWGKGILRSVDVEGLLSQVDFPEHEAHMKSKLISEIEKWSGETWEGAKVVRLIERVTRRLAWQLYRDKYIRRTSTNTYRRPQLPSALAIPNAPTVLPFHTFTCPLTASQVRKISQRNGLRISCSALKAPWFPSTIYPPPSPPSPYLRVGYVSSDFNNHPLAHLMQSVFGFHDESRVKAFCYATTASDKSTHREQIEREAPVFYDASSWQVDRLVKQIIDDGIHILVNLNGYTRGARNEVFAARPAPIQMSFMGFAGTLGAEWCDYLLADTTSIPPSTLRPWRRNVDLMDQVRDHNFDDNADDWVYSENIIYTRDTFFCCDHRQSAPDAQEAQLAWPEEQKRRRAMRKEVFPDLPEDAVILGNFNQLYKIEPTTFRTWLRILQAVPSAVLWLLRFPEPGEANLRQTALQWATPAVAARILFTDVAPKAQHIARGRICDLFLDTPECNGHTTAADVLWSGTPLLTYPRWPFKLCSRMAASILGGALPKTSAGQQAAAQLIVTSDAEYEARVIELAHELATVLQRRCQTTDDLASTNYISDRGGEEDGALHEDASQETCRLWELRRMLYEGRCSSALFDTRRWVRELEAAYEVAWQRWVRGEGGDIWLAEELGEE